MPPAPHAQHMFSLILLLLIHQCSHFTLVKCANIDANYGTTNVDAAPFVDTTTNDTAIALATPAIAPPAGIADNNSRAIQYHATLGAEKKMKIRRSQTTKSQARLFGPTFGTFGNLFFRGINFFQPELLTAGCTVAYLTTTYPKLASYMDIHTWVKYGFGKFREWRAKVQKFRNKIDHSLDDDIVDYKLKKLTTEDYVQHLKDVTRKRHKAEHSDLGTDDETNNQPVQLIDLEMSDTGQRVGKRRRRTLLKKDWDVKLEAYLLAMVTQYETTFAAGTFLNCVQIYIITAALRFIADFFV